MNFEHQILIQLTRIADSLEKLAGCTSIDHPKYTDNARLFMGISEVSQAPNHWWSVSSLSGDP